MLTDIYTVSQAVLTDIYTISQAVLTDICTVSQAVLTDIYTVSQAVLTDIYTVSQAVLTDICTVSQAVLTDICTVSQAVLTDICTVSQAVLSVQASSRILCLRLLWCQNTPEVAEFLGWDYGLLENSHQRESDFLLFQLRGLLEVLRGQRPDLALAYSLKGNYLFRNSK